MTTGTAAKGTYRSALMMALEWSLVSAVLPIAIPVLVAIAFFVIAGINDPLRHFLDQGDFLLAAVVLAGATIYDISDAFNSGRAKRGSLSVCRVLLWILAGMILVYYVVLRSALQFDPRLEPRLSTTYVGLVTYTTTCLFAFGVRVSMLKNGVKHG